MSNVESTSRSPFFPKGKDINKVGIKRSFQPPALERNHSYRVKELNSTTVGDVKVTIPDSIKDYSRIKKAVDAAPERDSSEKVASLKKQINDGLYQVNYEGIADKLLSNEF